MFKEFYSREIKSGLQQPMIYVFSILLGLLAFGAVSNDQIVIGGSIGNIQRNSPHIIMKMGLVFSLLGLFISTAFFNNAALRDFNNNFDDILFTTPIRKKDYFMGRFLGAFSLAILPFLGIYLGFILATFIAPAMGWVDPEKMGPVSIAGFMANYFLTIIPNIFISGVVIFSVASIFRSTAISFSGTMVLFLGYSIALSFSSDLENEMLAAMVDPFGLSAYNLDSKYFTPQEKNTLIPGFNSFITYNRLVWLIISFALLKVLYGFFSFEKRSGKVKKEKANKKDNTIFTKPIIYGHFSQFTDIAQCYSFTRIHLKSILSSNTFKILILFSFVQLIAILMEGYEYMGLKSYPVTYMVVEDIQNSTMIFLLIIMVYYAGDLLWEDRDNHLNEVIDASPHSSYVSLFAKYFAINVSILIIYASLSVLGILYQLGSGFTSIDLGTYFLAYALNIMPMIATWSAVLMLVHILINHKFIGFGVSIVLMFVLELILDGLDISSRMLDIASAPRITFSDISDYGPSVISSIWFNAYWIVFGIIVLLISGLLSNRGTSQSLLKRIKIIPQKMDPNFMGGIGTLFIVWLSIASFIFYNTQILNPYKTDDETELLQVQYEQKYKQYEGMLSPKIVDVDYNVNIYPAERNIYTVSQLKLVNENKESIDTLMYTYNDEWEIKFEIQNAVEVLHDKELNVKQFVLQKPLKHRDSLEIVIHANYITKGFKNSQENTMILENGTFFNNLVFLPYFGYNPSFELSDRFKRKEHNLPKRKRMPTLNEPCGAECEQNYLSNGQSDWITFETTISTSSDQMAIAPGSLIKQWTKNNRNFYHYRVDHKSQNFVSFNSGKFEVAKRQWKDVSMEVYYDQKHGVNIDKMLDAIENSLEYYTENFGPYYLKQARIIEFPRYANFAQAFPGTMPYSESFGFIVDLEDEEKNNVVDAVIAHEMAHQWWAHQEVGANVQGGTMLTESFAEYSSLMVMKKASDNDDVKMRNFLKYDYDRYLKGRSYELEKELPLREVENQMYLHYGKGSVIMYALQDFIGEDSVNAALRDFLTEYKYKAPPYPTSNDFLRHLQPRVPDSLQYLIVDWFEDITLYDYRIKEANLNEIDAENYEVSLQVEAKKFKSDSIGNEINIPVKDWVEIGFYKDNDEKELFYTEKIFLEKESQTIQIKLNEKPAKAMIDPKRLYVERVINDNSKKL
ncbi:M1 family aminopeptidase [Flammeovirga sp. SJP92]|uniref:ABC transporter permease/M1 family aminopeptidase n=1 Tax=Flammeovirga sp. SJP92 TaxID=1775430 RepID=UPI0007877326|nr:M1 family aminopeptidase [Flammeovirga sp. SJP92]